MTGGGGAGICQGRKEREKNVLIKIQSQREAKTNISSVNDLDTKDSRKSRRGRWVGKVYR